MFRDKAKVSMFPEEVVFVGDMFDPATVKNAAAGVGTIVHVPPRVYPRGDDCSQFAAHRRAHVESTRLVLEEAVSQRVQNFIFVSSAHATGQNRDRILCESTGDKPETTYARAKLEAENIVLSYAQRYSMNAVILRPVEIYGPGDKSVVSSLARAANRNIWLPLKGLEVQHSFVYVENLARAGLALLETTRERQEHRVFIVKDPADYRPDDLYIAICRALEKGPMLFQAPVQLLRIAGSIGDVCRRIPKIRALALFRQLATPRRYCGHLFNKSVPDFPFTGFEDAIRTTLSPSSGSV